MSKVELSDLLHDSAGLLEFASHFNFGVKESSTFCTEKLLEVESSKEQSQLKTSKHAVIRHITKVRASQKDLLIGEPSEDISASDQKQKCFSVDNDFDMKFPWREQNALSSIEDAAKVHGYKMAVQQAYNTYNDDEMTLALDSLSGIFGN